MIVLDFYIDDKDDHPATLIDYDKPIIKKRSPIIGVLIANKDVTPTYTKTLLTYFEFKGKAFRLVGEMFTPSYYTNQGYNNREVWWRNEIVNFTIEQLPEKRSDKLNEYIARF